MIHSEKTNHNTYLRARKSSLLTMKILLIVVGKTDQKWLIDGISQYTERLTHFAQFEMLVIPDIRNNKNMDQNTQKVREGEQILNLLQLSDDVWLLDDKGREMTSPEMARWLEKRMAQSTKRLVFIIGGPYGFSPDVYDRVPGRLSLSRMTFSHQMVVGAKVSNWLMRKL